MNEMQRSSTPRTSDEPASDPRSVQAPRVRNPCYVNTWANIVGAQATIRRASSPLARVRSKAAAVSAFVTCFLARLPPLLHADKGYESNAIRTQVEERHDAQHPTQGPS